jgi:hypothetical protein
MRADSWNSSIIGGATIYNFSSNQFNNRFPTGESPDIPLKARLETPLYNTIQLIRSYCAEGWSLPRPSQPLVRMAHPSSEPNRRCLCVK